MPKKPENALLYADGLRFSCKCCSHCCRYESGFVFLSENDVYGLAASLNIKNNEFISAFCRWIPVGNGLNQLSLKEKSNFDCVFWKININDRAKGGCSVYNSRPLQCRAFPFWSSMVNSRESWENAAEDCPGIGKGEFHSCDSRNNWLVRRESEPIISRKITENDKAGLVSGNSIISVCRA